MEYKPSMNPKHYVCNLQFINVEKTLGQTFVLIRVSLLMQNPES
jgi:hypothetical protein